ncbi:Enolase-phosphatase E1, partial [Goodea atripinnis]
DILFPYIVEHLEDYLSTHWEEDECKQDVHLLKKQIEEDMRQNRACPVHAVDQTVHTDEEKAIREVVESVIVCKVCLKMTTCPDDIDPFANRIYPDVVPSIKTWREHGLKVYIYSSGSVEAQKLLFRYSVEGDVLDVSDSLNSLTFIFASTMLGSSVC